MYGERIYWDTPEENPEGYAQADILPKVKKYPLPFAGDARSANHSPCVGSTPYSFYNKPVKRCRIGYYFVYPAHEPQCERN